MTAHTHPAGGPSVTIGGRRIAADAPTYVIAEVGVNHNGDAAMARRLVDAAAQAGADAVKFQTFKAEATASPAAERAAYQGTGGGQQELLKALELSAEDFAGLAAQCRALGVDFLSTAFDLESLALIDRLDPPALKSPSGEIDNILLLDALGALRRPIILSTGTASIGEVETALRRVEAAGAPGVAILHCTSAYPAPPDALNLRAIETLARAFARPVGFSDHSDGVWAALAARPLGMAVLEKHVTLDRSLPGPDHAASLEIPAFAALVRSLRAVEAALGDGIKRPAPVEADVARVARRSLHAARPIAAGATVTRDDLTALRPAGGAPPAAADWIIGRRARRAIAAGAPIAPTDLE